MTRQPFSDGVILTQPSFLRGDGASQDVIQEAGEEDYAERSTHILAKTNPFLTPQGANTRRSRVLTSLQEEEDDEDGGGDVQEITTKV